MKMIKKVSDAIRENIHEAKEKIDTAYHLRETDKAVADWYKDMAAAHLAFNTNGHNVVVKLIEAAKIEKNGNPLLPGMMAAYTEIHTGLRRKEAEVQAMIQTYK